MVNDYDHKQQEHIDWLSDANALIGKEIELRDNAAREGKNTGHTHETLDPRAAGASEVEEVD